MTLDRTAEQAVIGALLLRPDRYDDVREWLELDDFDGSNERIVFDAIQGLHGEGFEASPEAVNEWVLNHEPQPLPRADGAFLGQCMRACPAPDQAAVYGRMVLESSIRRRVGSAAAGLRQKAEEATSSDELNRVFFAVDRVRREVESLHDRETLANSWHGPTPLEPVHLDSVYRRLRPEDTGVERTAILALIDQPSALQTVGEWLGPDDFNDLTSRLIYGEMQRMNRDREHIDRLTVAWTVAADGIDGSIVERLAEQPDPARLPSDAVLAARAVLEHSVKSLVIDTANEVEQSSLRRTHANTSGEAHARLNQLWPNQRRLIQSSL